MSDYNKIDNALKDVFCKRDNTDRPRKVIIYPFGQMGMQTKEVLNNRYGILEEIIVDNFLADVNPRIKKVEEVESPENYIWIIAVADKSVRQSIMATLPSIIPENCIVTIFKEEVKEEVKKEVKRVYSDDFKALSHLETDGGYGGCITPAWEVLECVKKKKRDKRVISVAEIGIDIGATAVEVCKLLDSEDKYYGFDYEDKVNALFEDFNRLPDIVCELYAEGNTRKPSDSYNWRLSKMLLDMQENQIDGVFDVVYLDGAHSFSIDGLACCLIKKLLKRGGYIIFDDVDLSFKNNSSEGRLAILRESYPEEQLADKQVRRVINIFMQGDEGFQEIYLRKLVDWRAVYQRIR